MANVLNNNAAIEACEKLYLNEEFADVYFVVGVDDEIQRVPANKIKLAVLSPVFKAMFYGSLPEKKDVRITDADADGFKEFLQIFYLRKVKLTMENIQTVVRLADKYDVLGYINACAVFLKGQLTLDNMCWGYQLTVFLKNDELIKFCEGKISQSPKKIFTTDAFKFCDKSTLKRILELNLKCMETDIFTACLKWAKNACRQDDMDETQAVNLKTKLGDCLQSIRFNSMTTEEFSTFATSNNGLFTSDEFMDIILNSTMKGYESKVFNKIPRHSIWIPWNENKILICKREDVSPKFGSQQYQNIFTGFGRTPPQTGKISTKRYVQKSEVAWFTSNQRVSLGEISSAYTYNLHCISLLKAVIAEIGTDFSKKVLYEGLSKWDGNTLKVSLSQPITIKPNVVYEICFEVQLNNPNSSYYYGTWDPTVELKDGLEIKFHRNPTYDISVSGWIQSLSFNRL